MKESNIQTQTSFFRGHEKALWRDIILFYSLKINIIYYDCTQAAPAEFLCTHSLLFAKNLENKFVLLKRIYLLMSDDIAAQR